jgi:N-acetyl-D-muramate 6-phosphate phosphatase
MLPAQKLAQLRQNGGVYFDLDGTLLDTAADFQMVLNSLCIDHGIVPPAPTAVQATVSAGARALVAMTFNMDAGDSAFAGLLEEMLHRYGQQIVNSQARLYPGMAELLEQLEQANIVWGVVTNKPVRYSRPLLQSLGLLHRCNVVICPDDVQRTKPDPEPLLLAAARTNKDATCSIYVGDHPRDIDAGKAAGMTTIAAAYGYLPDSPAIELWGADIVVTDVMQISKLLWP